MKRNTNMLTVAVVAVGISVAAMLGGGTARAGIIYSDNFTRTGTLDGSAPEVRPGSQTWFAHANWTTDGAKAKHQVAGAYGNHGMLPFTPEAGRIYRLKAEIDANAANAGWFVGIGFFTIK